MTDSTAASGDTLADDLRNVVYEAEALLDALGDDADESVHALRERVYAAVDTAKMRLTDMETQADHFTQRAAVAAENYVREHPWTAVAIGAALGLALGVLVARWAAAAPSDDQRSTAER